MHGRIVAFSGTTFDHNHIADNVQARLNAALGFPCYAYGTDIIIETIARKADNGFRADVVVTCSQDDTGTGRYLKQPQIIVEVRSPKSNVGKQWDAKLLEYWSTPSIVQLVVIESNVRSVSSYCRVSSGTWRPGVETIETGSVKFPSVDIEMSLDDVYRRTTLAKNA